MPALAAAARSGVKADRSTSDTAIPSAFPRSAARKAFTVSSTLLRGDPVHCVVQRTRAAASCAPNCVAT